MNLEQHAEQELDRICEKYFQVGRDHIAFMLILSSHATNLENKHLLALRDNAMIVIPNSNGTARVLCSAASIFGGASEDAGNMIVNYENVFLEDVDPAIRKALREEVLKLAVDIVKLSMEKIRNAAVETDNLIDRLRNGSAPTNGPTEGPVNG